MYMVQMTDPSGNIPDVWNVMKSPSADTDPSAYALGLSQNTEYHIGLGYTGTLAIVTFADALSLLARAQASPSCASLLLQ